MNARPLLGAVVLLLLPLALPADEKKPAAACSRTAPAR